jgi:methyl coenzyme M reductase beta subunit
MHQVLGGSIGLPQVAFAKAQQVAGFQFVGIAIYHIAGAPFDNVGYIVIFHRAGLYAPTGVAFLKHKVGNIRNKIIQNRFFHISLLYVML